MPYIVAKVFILNISKRGGSKKENEIKKTYNAWEKGVPSEICIYKISRTLFSICILQLNEISVIVNELDVTVNNKSKNAYCIFNIVK